jgi:hypothetical protein
MAAVVERARQLVQRAGEGAPRSANPPAEARVDYGMKDEHCWSGDHEHINAISRLNYHARFIPLMADRWQKTAPAGADTKSWRY